MTFCYLFQRRHVPGFARSLVLVIDWDNLKCCMFSVHLNNFVMQIHLVHSDEYQILALRLHHLFSVESSFSRLGIESRRDCEGETRPGLTLEAKESSS